MHLPFPIVDLQYTDANIRIFAYLGHERLTLTVFSMFIPHLKNKYMEIGYIQVLFGSFV